jgi:hypothetical protein
MAQIHVREFVLSFPTMIVEHSERDAASDADSLEGSAIVIVPRQRRNLKLFSALSVGMWSIVSFPDDHWKSLQRSM